MNKILFSLIIISIGVCFSSCSKPLHEKDIDNHIYYGYENDAQLFDDASKDFIGPRGRPEGALGHLAHGIFKGLAHGARSRAIAQEQANSRKTFVCESPSHPYTSYLIMDDNLYPDGD
jgi:hypothetical protein